MNEQDYPPLPAVVRVGSAAYLLMKMWVNADRAQQSARHAEELLAYEVTVGNLRAQREQAQPVAHENCVPVACLVETDSGVMVWPIRNSAEACTYCDPDEIPQMLYLHPAAPQAQPVATLHDDGYWTWKQGRPPYASNYAGWRMDVYAAPQAQPERKPMTESEMLEGRERTFSVDNPYFPCDRKTFMKVARYVEAFHVIFGGKP